MLLPPTSYQGAKNRIAKQIVSLLLAKASPISHFYDLCCGSGAVSVELLNQGIAPSRITMCDAGPWGLFWKEVGAGTFDLPLMRALVEKLPKDLSDIKSYMVALSRRLASTETTQTFLLLQASSFGSKPIWIEGDSWKNCSFRSYWMPTATSNRRSPVNPMMPLPASLLSRVEKLCVEGKGITGICGDVSLVDPVDDSVVYIDPPYQGTTPYGHTLDVVTLAKSIQQPCYVSEGKPLSEKAVRLATEEARKKGGISGSKKIRPNEEWISLFEKS